MSIELFSNLSSPAALKCLQLPFATPSSGGRAKTHRREFRGKIAGRIWKKKKKSFESSRNSVNSAVFCQCYSNTPSCSSNLRAKDRSPAHPPAGSLRNDKRQVGSAAPVAVGPSGTLKTNDNVLGALCRIMKMYPCAPSESERHPHFKSADPSPQKPTAGPSPLHSLHSPGGKWERRRRGASISGRTAARAEKEARRE